MIFKQSAMKNFKIITFLLVFSLVTYIWSFNKDFQKVKDLESKSGTLNIEEIETNTLYRLKGEWEFYPEVFILEDELSQIQLKHDFRNIEHEWNTDNSFENGYGYATYRLLLTGLDPEMEYGLLLEEAGSSYRLSINGKKILSNGVIGKNSLTTMGESFTDKDVFKSDLNGNAEIIIEVSNYEKVNSGFIYAPLFGDFDDILYFYETSIFVELFAFSAMFSFSVLFLLIYIIIKDRRSLFMSLLCFLFAVRIMSTGSHIIYFFNPYFNLPLIWVLRLEYLSVFLMLPTFNLLSNTFSIFKFNQRYRTIAYSIILFFLFASVLLNHSGLEFLYLVFQVLIGIFGIHYLYYAYLAYRKQTLNIYSIFILIASIASAMISNYFIQDTRYSFYFMIMIFTLFVAASVIHRFSIISERTIHLENIVKIDPLTKLWNRSYLNELRFDMSKYESNDLFFVLFIDLNGFKEINDEYGHKIGDEVLRITARRLRNSCHETDMIFRMGGDEFVIIAHMKDRNSIEKVIKRIRDNFSEPFAIGELKLNLSLAIGFHQFVPNSDDLETIIAMSDKKMYEDKRRQSNQ